MKIAFVTTQSLSGSTVIGRVLPLASDLAKNHEVYVLGHDPLSESGERAGVRWKNIGKDPFSKTPSGKKRLKGIFLIARLKWNTIFAALKLISLKPDVIVIEKSLPENVLATWLAARIIHPKKIILDVDDFELTANVTTGWLQRAAIHWAERSSAKLASHIVTVAPFLSDHFEQLTQGKKRITMIPTGLSLNTPEVSPAGDSSGVAERGSLGASFTSQESAAADTSEVFPARSLVYAGSLSLASGHRIDMLPKILAEVRKKYPEIKLHVYGTGDDEKLLKNEEGIVLHGRFDLHAAETGFATPEEQATASTSGVIMLDPIDDAVTNRSKSSFRVALAAVLGLPVVSSNIGIRPYLIPDSLHPRFFAKPGGAESYANKVLNLMNNPLSSQEQETLKKHGAQFTWLQLAQKYEKIIAS